MNLMSGQNDDNSLLKMAGVMAAALTGGYMLWNKLRTKSPDELEQEALDLLEEADNPYSESDLAKMRKAHQMLEEVQTLRFYERMQQRGLPVERKSEQAVLDMIRHSSYSGDGNWEKYQEAFNRFVAQTRQDQERLRPPGMSQLSRCDFCGDVGYNICPTCAGTGRNRLMPSPNYTGNRAVDELISLRYQNDSVCRHCNGSGQLICRFCPPAASGRR
jgi:hypothetical protein